MEFKNKTLSCCQCGQDFTFSAGEQEFFHQRNLINTPKRCPNCRLTLRFARLGRDVTQLSDVKCADCDKQTKVPFKPRGHRPVYCNDCMARKRLLEALMKTVTDPELMTDSTDVLLAAHVPDDKEMSAAHSLS